MKLLVGVLSVIFLFSCSSKLSEQEYYQKAKEAYGNQKFAEAIENFKGLVDNYSESKYRAEALFLLGFINANDIQDLEQAKIFYEKFLAEFPNHDLADDAEYELKTLGKDINELPIFQNANADSVAETVSK